MENSMSHDAVCRNDVYSNRQTKRWRRKKKYFCLNSQQRYQPTSSTLLLTGIPTAPEMHHYHKHQHLTVLQLLIISWAQENWAYRGKQAIIGNYEKWNVSIMLFGWLHSQRLKTNNLPDSVVCLKKKKNVLVKQSRILQLKSRDNSDHF